MSHPNVIDRLGVPGHFPEDTVRYCLTHPEESFPVLLDLLEAKASGRGLTEREDNALFLGIHILAEARECKAFPLLVKLLRRGDEESVAFFGDAITETLGQILIAFNGPADVLEEAIADSELDDFVREAFLIAWTHGVLTGKITEYAAKMFLRSFPQTIRPKPDSFLWEAWASAIADLQFSDLFDDVEATFHSDLIRRDEFGLFASEVEDFRYRVRSAAQATDRQVWMRQNRYCAFDNTVSSLRDWATARSDQLGRMVPVEETTYLMAAEEGSPFTSGSADAKGNGATPPDGKFSH